ncbi:MAG: dynamin family protein [Pseudomonadota bacterium]
MSEHLRIRLYSLLLKMAAEPGFSENAASLKQAADSLKIRECRILFVGEFSGGKSSIINALVGKPILPVNIFPTTAFPTEVRGLPVPGDPEFAWWKADESSSFKRITLEEAKELYGIKAGTIGPGNMAPNLAALLKMVVKSKRLGGEIVLVDTPGIGALNEAHAVITYEYVPQAHAVVVVDDISAALKLSIKEFLVNYVLPLSGLKLFYVVNKIDRDGGGDVAAQAVKDNVERGLQAMPELAGRVPQVYMTSAVWADEGKWKESGVERLWDDIQSFVGNEADRQVILRTIDRCLDWIDGGISSNDGMMNAGDLTLSALQEKLNIAKGQENEIRRTFVELAEEAKLKAEEMFDGFQENLRELLDDWKREILTRIENSEGQLGNRLVEQILREETKDLAVGLREAESDLKRDLQELVKSNRDQGSIRLATLLKRININLDTEWKLLDGSKWAGLAGAVLAIDYALPLGFVTAIIGQSLLKSFGFDLAGKIFHVITTVFVMPRILEQVKETLENKIDETMDALPGRFDAIIRQIDAEMKNNADQAASAVLKTINETISQLRQRETAREEWIDEVRDRVAMLRAWQSELLTMKAQAELPM